MGEYHQDNPNKMSRREFIGLFDPRKYHESEPHGRPFSVTVVGPNEEVPSDHIWFTDLATLPMYDLEGPKPTPPKFQNIAFLPHSPRINSPSPPMWVETVFLADVGQAVNDKDLLKVLAEWYGAPLAEMFVGSQIIKACSSDTAMSRRQFLGAAGGMIMFLAGGGSFFLNTIPANMKIGGVDPVRAEYSTQSKIASMRDMIIMEDIWTQYGRDYGYNPIVATSFSELDGLEQFANKKPDTLKKNLLLNRDLREGLVAAVSNVHEQLDHGVDRFFRHRVHINNKMFDRNLSDTGFIEQLKQYLFPQIPPVPLPYQELAA